MTTNSHKHRVGVLRDFTQADLPGSAQLATERYLQVAPDNVEVVVCSPDDPVERGLDAYVSFLCKRYQDDDLQYIADHPRHVRVGLDWWQATEPQARWSKTLWDSAAVAVFCSPLHRDRLERMQHIEPKRSVIIPMPLEPRTPFAELRLARQQVTAIGKRPALWAGRWCADKGGDIVLRWAEEYQRSVDVFGMQSQQGQLTRQVAGKGFCSDDTWYETMAGYDELISFPRQPEPFGYTLLEAYLLGLKVTYTNEIGLFSYDMPPEQVAGQCMIAGELLWKQVSRVLAS